MGAATWAVSTVKQEQLDVLGEMLGAQDHLLEGKEWVFPEKQTSTGALPWNSGYVSWACEPGTKDVASLCFGELSRVIAP